MNVSTEVLGSARIVSWDNQRHRNAWGGATIAAIADAVQVAGTDPDVRCIVVRGAGEDFSAGDDLFEAADADQESFAATIDEFQRLTQVVLESLVPVIAAIDGVCIGGRSSSPPPATSASDTDRARFATPEVRIGLGASNAGTLLLPEVLGESAARELLLTGALKDAAGWTATASSTRRPTTSTPGSRARRRVRPHTRPPCDATKRMLNERFGDLLPARRWSARR